jgi:hypothetical protein
MSNSEILTDEEMMEIFNLPSQLYHANGCPEIIYETPESNPSARRSFRRGSICDIQYIDVSDCSSNTRLDRAIRQLKMMEPCSNADE